MSNPLQPGDRVRLTPLGVQRNPRLFDKPQMGMFLRYFASRFEKREYAVVQLDHDGTTGHFQPDSWETIK